MTAYKKTCKELEKLWHEGSVKVGNDWYRYWVKQYERGSQYGIDEGRVSKLQIRRNDAIVANYDRGWDVEPVDDATKTALAIILDQYNR